MKLKMILVGLLLSIGLSACGQKGPLRLPDAPKLLKPMSAVGTQP